MINNDNGQELPLWDKTSKQYDDKAVLGNAQLEQSGLNSDGTPTTWTIPQIRRLVVLMVLSSLVYGALFLFTLFLAAMSVMFFDSGFSLLALVLALLVASLPLLVVVSCVTMWRNYQLQNYRLALLKALMPFVFFLPWVILSIFN